MQGSRTVVRLIHRCLEDESRRRVCREASETRVHDERYAVCHQPTRADVRARSQVGAAKPTLVHEVSHRAADAACARESRAKRAVLPDGDVHAEMRVLDAGRGMDTNRRRIDWLVGPHVHAGALAAPRRDVDG